MGHAQPMQQDEGQWQLYLHILNTPGLLVIKTRQSINLAECHKLTVLQAAEVLINYCIVAHLS